MKLKYVPFISMSNKVEYFHSKLNFMHSFHAFDEIIDLEHLCKKISLDSILYRTLLGSNIEPTNHLSNVMNVQILTNGSDL